MVQIFERGPSRGALQAQLLGQSLGEGLGALTGQYFSNRALEKVLNDPSLKDAPVSERLSKIESALRPFGERGRQMFKTRLGLEQQAIQEKEQARQQRERLQQKEAASTLWKSLHPGEEIPEGLSAKEVIDLEKIRSAERRQAMRPAPGGITAQSVPEIWSEKIDKILKENKDANSDELNLAFNKEKIPPIYTNQYVENRRRMDEAKAKTTEKGESRKIEIHKLSDTEDKEIQKAGNRAKKQLITVEDMMKDLKSGKIKPRSISAIFRNMGSIGDKVADAFLNAEEGRFEAALPNLIEGWKEVFGVRLSDADLRIIQNKLPGLGKSVEANEAILNLIKKYAEPSIEKEKAANEIKREYGGFRPINYVDLIEQRIDENRQKKEMQKKEAKRGTKVTQDEALEYIRQADGDVNKAMEMARSDGREF